MTAAWQEVIVAAAVLWAVAILVRRTWRWARPKVGGCGSACGGCAASSKRSKPLISLGVPKISEARRTRK